MSKALAVIALTAATANAADYTWTKGTKICAGIKVPCTDKATCSSTAIGPCPGADNKKPTAYLESEFVGLAYVDSKKYLDTTTGKASSDAKTYNIVEASGPGFRDYKGAVKADKGTFAFTMAGNVFGDTKDAGGYAGIVSYLNTGTTALETNTAYVFGADTGDAQKDRSKDTEGWSESTKGAPNGPFLACISQIGADKKCGAARTIKPDEYKFSIFGTVKGTNYDAKVKAGEGKFPAAMDKLGVRMQLKATGFAVKDLKVNGKSWTPSMVNEDVKSMFIMHDSGGLNLEFPKKYNTGPTTGAAPKKELTNEGTHDMAIRISTVDTAAQTIMIDYLFDTSKLKADTWFIYDPDVSEVAKGSPDPNAPTTKGSSANTYTIAAATFSAVAAVVGLLM